MHRTDAAGIAFDFRAEMPSEPPERCIGFETSATAGRAGGVATIFRQQDPHMHFVSTGLQPIEKALRPIPLRFPRMVAAFPIGCALNHPLPLVFIEIGPRRVQSYPAARGVLLHFDLAFFIAGCLPWADGSFT